jgi:hypothetical protein
MLTSSYVYPLSLTHYALTKKLIYVMYSQDKVHVVSSYLLKCLVKYNNFNLLCSGRPLLQLHKLTSA